MKRLVVLLMIFAIMGCSSKEERRDSLIANAKKLEQADKCPEAKIEARNALKLDPNATEAYLVLAKCAMKEQNWRDAFGSFSRALELEPENPDAMEQLSRLFLMANEVEKAKELSEKLLAVDPSSVNYRIIRAGVAIREKQLAQSIRMLKEILSEQPHHEEAVVGLATAYMDNGQLDEARALVSDAMAHNDKSAVLVNYMVNIALLQRDYDTAIANLQKLREFQPNNEAIILRIADMYLITGKIDQALSFLENELKAGPEKNGLRSRMAELLYNNGKNEEGIAVIDAAPKMAPLLHITKATGLLRINKTDEAIAELKKVGDDPNAGPEALRAKQRMAEIYVLRNNSDAAMKELDEIIQRNPGDNKAMALRGRIHYLRGNYTEAVADLRVVLRDNPKDSPSALALAESQRLLGNARLAEETLRASISAAPNYAPSYFVLSGMQRAQGNHSAALETLRSAAASTGIADLHFAYVDNLVSEKRYNDAQAYLLKLMSEKEDLAIPAYIRLAAMNAEQRKFTQARDFYSKALEINPDYYQAAEGFVLMEVSAGRSQQALAWIQQRSEERPEDPNTIALLAEVYNENKKYDEAITAFKNASKLAPQWDRPYVRIMQIYNAQLNKPEVAVEYLKTSMEANPEVATPAVILASYYESVKKYDEAEKLYRDVLAKNPDLIAVSNNLAYIMTLHNATPARLDEAQALSIKAAASNTPETLDTLGWVYYKQNKLPEALENLNKAYEGGGSNSPTISYHLALVHNAIGNKEEAKKILTELLGKFEKFDGREEAEELLQQL